MMKITQLLNKHLNSFLVKKNILRMFSTFKYNKTFIYTNKQYFSTDNIISEKESLELIEAGVFEVLKSAAKCRHGKLNRSATFEELGFDSLDQVELVVAMEEKFGINMLDDDTLKIQSVLDAIQMCHSYYLKTKSNVGTEVEKKDDKNELENKREK